MVWRADGQATVTRQQIVDAMTDVGLSPRAALRTVEHASITQRVS